ncbi:MAG: hypothetical protein ACKVQJ_11245 [Pyrinomonadaceae bacterium]
MSVTEILREVEKLSPIEKEQVLGALRRSGDPTNGTDPVALQAELFRRLQKKGMLSSVPSRRPTPGDFDPIPIKGKPLSQTIIEDRR